DAGDLGAGLEQGRDPLEAVLEQLLDVAELARDSRLREVEDDLLGPVDELGCLAFPVDAEPCDLVPRADQAAERRHLADDKRVVAWVRGGGKDWGQRVDPHAPPAAPGLAARPEPAAERDGATIP